MTEFAKIAAGLPHSEDYRVWIDGQEADTDIARVSAKKINRYVSGKERPLEETEIASFVSCFADAPVQVRVLPARPFKEAVVRPLHKNVHITREGEALCFTIAERGQYSLELDGPSRPLAIFVNEKEGEPDEGAWDLYFAPGTHDAGRIELKNNMRVYIARGAVVYGAFMGHGVENVEIAGEGILDGSKEKRGSDDCYNDDTAGCMKFRSCKNIRIGGIVCRDPALWTISLFACENIVIDNIKLIGLWRHNADGIDFCNTSNVCLKNSFLRCFDDCVVIKGLPGYGYRNAENYLVENCVVWCDWGRALEIGAETVADEMKNILFRGCSVIRSDFSSLDVQNCDRAAVTQVVFENIRIEYDKYRDNKPRPVFVGVHNGYCGMHFDDPNVVGRNENILFKDIYIDAEGEIGPLQFVGFDEAHTSKNIRFENIFINGKRAEGMNAFQVLTEGCIDLSEIGWK